MARVLESFMIGLGLKTDQSSFGQAQSAVSGITATIGKAVLVAKGLQGAFVAATIGVARGLDQLLKSADKIGISAAEMDKWRYVADMTDTSVQQLQRSMEVLTRRAGDAAAKASGPAGQAFQKLGINVKDANGNIKNSSVLMEEVGQALAGLDKAEQISLGQKLGLDRATIDSITQDLDGITKEYELMAGVAGLSMNEAAKAADELMNELSRFQNFTQMLYRSVFTEFIIRLRNGFASLRLWMMDNAETIQRVIRGTMTIVNALGDIITGVFTFIARNVQALIGWWHDLDESQQTVVASLGALAAGIYLINKAMKASPIYWVIAGIAGILALLDDFQVWKEGGVSLIDWGPYADQVQAVLDTFKNLFDFIIQGFADIAANPVFWEFLESVGDLLWTWYEFFENIITLVIRLLTLDLAGAAETAGKMISNSFIYAQIMIQGIISLLEAFLSLLGFDVIAAADNMREAVTNAFDWIANGIQDVIGKLQDFMGWITGAISKVKEFFGLGSQEAPAPSAPETRSAEQLEQIAQVEALMQQGRREEAMALAARFAAERREQESMAERVSPEAVVQHQRARRAGEKSENLQRMEEYFDQNPEAVAAATRRRPQLTAEATQVEVPPLITSQTAAAGGEPIAGDSNFNNDQSVHVEINNTYQIDGSGDPSATASEIESRQGDVARNYVSAVTYSPARGGA